MNERYLYRGKRNDNGKWITGYIRQFNENQVCMFRYPYMSLDKGTWIDFSTIGQFTGLRDKNGVLIFEGDILLLSKTNPVKFIVSVEMGKNGYKTVWRYADDGVVAGSGYFLDNLEIIGNIHDNPELMKGGGASG